MSFIGEGRLIDTYEVRRLPVWSEIQEIRRESKGSRRKFWISIEDEPNTWLLKYPRSNTGEHWAEKVAAEVGSLIGVHCAGVELAEVGGELVTVCESFDIGTWYDLYDYVDESIEPFDEASIDFGTINWHTGLNPSESMEPTFFEGWFVLELTVDGYDVEKRFGQRDHNVDNIVMAVKRFVQRFTEDWNDQADAILRDVASYAILDGLIGNTDRHHENWMLKLERKRGQVWVSAAPSYDHASSLGRELNDKARQRMLRENGVSRYLRRGRGGVYDDGTRQRAPSPLELAKNLCQQWPAYTGKTLDAIAVARDDDFRTIVDMVPSEFMSATAKEFAYRSLITSKTELLENVR